MLHQNTREALAWAIADIHAKGMAQGTGGNFSAVIDAEPTCLLMSPSGVDKGMIAPAALIEIDHTGQVVSGEGAASAETLLHLKIAAMTGAKAVFHTHSIFGTLLSMHALKQKKLEFFGYEMLKGIEGVKTHETLVELPIIENSQDMRSLSQTADQLLTQKPHIYAFLVAGHGLYVWGNSLFQTRRHLEIFEFLLELTYRNLVLSNSVNAADL